MSERTVVKKKKKWGKIFEYTPTVRSSILTEELAEEIEKDVKNSNAITPQSLANKHNIKVSLAKRILKKLEEKGDLKLVHSSGKNKLYSK